jgi:hypothetical protein
MKRSGGVTVAAVVLFFGSGLLALFALIAIASAALIPSPPAVRYAQLLGLAFYAGFAAWGIATGVGILQLRCWARISTIVMSAVAIFFCVCGAIGLTLVPMILRQTPDMPSAFGTIAVTVGAVMLLIPLAIAIWWLVLFTRKRVVVEFAIRGAAQPSLASLESPPPMPSSSPPQHPTAPGAVGIPISIRIITIFLIIGGGIALLSVQFAIHTNVPTMLLGVLVQGRRTWAFLAVLAVVQLGVCIAILKRRLWALDALIVVLLFGIVNTILFALSPSRNAVFDRVMRAESLPPGVNLSAMRDVMNTVFPVSMGLGVVLTAVMLYFLLTRRKAFRAACSAHVPRAPAAGQGASL